MDVLSHLTTLIKTHKEVGIPGLGTIYKKKSPGRYDAASHSFLPPSYLIHFTSDLKEDTLLISLISKEEHISADLAVHHIEEFSQHILDELADHQTVNFGQLGQFSIETGSLNFTSKKDQLFGFEFYGLPALSADLAPDQDIQPAYEEPVHIEVTPEQLELENNNADLGDGTTNIEPEVQLPPFVETPENIEPVEDSIEENLTQENPIEENPIEENLIEEHLISEDPISAIEVAAPTEIIPEIEPVAELKQEEDLVENIAPSIDAKDDTPFVLISESAENKSSASSFYVNSVVIPEQKSPVYKKLWIWIVIIAVLISLVYLLKPELFKGVVPHNEHNATPPVQKQITPPTADTIPVTDTAATADSIRISNEKAIAKIDSAKKTAAAVPTLADDPANATMRYEILAASLANQQEADNFLAQMKKRGIPAKIADLKGRRIKITLGTFTDEKKAREQLLILREATKLPGIYILPTRHTKQH